jgi:hypothetical protein
LNQRLEEILKDLGIKYEQDNYKIR